MDAVGKRVRVDRERRNYALAGAAGAFFALRFTAFLFAFRPTVFFLAVWAFSMRSTTNPLAPLPLARLTEYPLLPRLMDLSVTSDLSALLSLIATGSFVMDEVAEACCFCHS